MVCARVGFGFVGPGWPLGAPVRALYGAPTYA